MTAPDPATERRDERNAKWERRYAEPGRVWSGRVNATLAAVAELLVPGSALEVGCGEGADAIWLAERGWRVTAVDVSASAVATARVAASERGLGADRVRFVAGDAEAPLGGAWNTDADERFDLVVSSFLHSWEEDFPRIAILQATSALVAPGGRLLTISHAAPPPWARDHHAPVMRTPTEELALLDLDPHTWVTERVEVIAREARDPDGNPATLDDGILLLRRR